MSREEFRLDKVAIRMVKDLMNMKLDWRRVGEYYKDLRPSTLRTHKYRHLFLIVFWPIFGLVFMTLEKYWPSIWQSISGSPLVYREVVSILDAYIPFCEWI